MRQIVLMLCVVASVGGCSTPRQVAVPLNVAMVPNDCRNREIMIDWLLGQARLPQQRGESNLDYARSRNEIKQKIWDLRYHCQPV